MITWMQVIQLKRRIIRSIKWKADKERRTLTDAEYQEIADYYDQIDRYLIYQRIGLPVPRGAK